MHRLLGAMALLFTTIAHAYELDWSDVSWTGSTNSNQSDTFLNVDGSGIDVSISLSISTGNFATSTFISNDNMLLAADYPDRDRLGNYIDVSFSFSKPVRTVSFSLNDVDRGGTSSSAYWEDVIENLSGDGTASFVGSEITVDTTTDPGDTLYRGQDYNNWNSDSRLTLFWDSAVSNVSFRYAGGENTRRNPGYQIIGMGNITFYEAVPEPSTYIFGGLISLAMIGFIIRRKRALRKIEPTETAANHT